MDSNNNYVASRLRLLLILGLFALAFVLRDLLLFTFVSFIFMTALNPAVTFLQNRLKLNRTLASAAVLAICLLFVTLILILTAGSIASSFQTLPQNLINGWESARDELLGQPRIREFVENINSSTINQVIGILQGFLGNLLSLSFTIFGLGAGLLAFIFLTFYLLIEWPGIVTYILSYFPNKQDAVGQKIHLVQHQLGGWLRGQLLNMFVVGLVTFIGLSLIGVPNALALAVLAGLFELIPYVGPTIAAIPAVIIALAASDNMAIATIILYVLIQQIESNFLVPYVMKQAVHLNPVVSLLAVIIWAQLLGALGAILALPLTTVVLIIVEEVRKKYLNSLRTKSENKKIGK